MSGFLPAPRTMFLPGFFNRSWYTVTGGPWSKRPDSAVGVCMLDRDNDGDIRVPTRDYQTPEVPLLLDGLKVALQSIAAGEPVYVGCGWGQGRTGLFLAVLAKAWGLNDPVRYAREHYNPKAVETPDQERYVDDIVIPFDIKLAVFNAKAKLWVLSLFSTGNQTTSHLSGDMVD